MGRYLVGVLLFAASCGKVSSLDCAKGPCTEPGFPFCDVDGSLGGKPNTCIAVDCMPTQFIACRGSTAITCNANGNDYDLTQCQMGCDEVSRGCTVPPSERVPYIVFEATRDGNSEIYRMNPDGSLPTNLTHNTAEDTNPLWDPTGERIAFLSTRSGVQELYTMKPDGTDVIDVSQGQASEPAWSADGLHLAFTSTRSSQPEIYSTLATSAAPMPLTSFGVAGTGQASWEPNGAHIAFVTGGRINVMNANGTGAVPVTAGAPRGDWGPVWNPTGTKIAFRRGLNFENHDVFVMDPDGGNASDVTLTPSTLTFEDKYSWSPSGAYLVGGINDGDSSSPNLGAGIFVVQANGGGFNYVVTPTAYAPCWSPDGGQIAFQRDAGGSRDIFVVARTGGPSTNLTSSAGNDTSCSWRPR